MSKFTNLTLSDRQTKTDTFANSLDPDETACNEPSHQGLQCLSFCFWFLTGIPICNSGHVQIQSWNRPLQKLRGERVTAPWKNDFLKNVKSRVGLLYLRMPSKRLVSLPNYYPQPQPPQPHKFTNKAHHFTTVRFFRGDCLSLGLL